MKTRKVEYDYKKFATQSEWKCENCETCWRWLDGPYAGRCIFGGPFNGWNKLPGWEGWGLPLDFIHKFSPCSKKPPEV